MNIGHPLSLLRFVIAMVAIAQVLFTGRLGLAAPPADAVLFEAGVQEIFQNKCVECHGPKNLKAELDLATPAGVLKGSESGPIVEPGKLDESLLYDMVHEGLMPPEDKDPLTPAELETIREWIAKGAHFATTGDRKDLQITHHDIEPILQLRCTACHGSRRREAGLDLRTVESILKGGKSGPAAIAGKPEESLILKRIHAGEMPPRKDLVSVSIKVIAPDEVERLTEWIARGLSVSPNGPDVATTDPDSLVSDEDRQFWAFQPPTQGAVPEVAGADGALNPIDAFISRKLKEVGLSLSSQADRLTLLRRACFDLTGLPPSPEMIESFLSDTGPFAYERLIDRLLASPRYGERWGRYWLDLAGYSDSEGVQNSDLVRPHVWQYRDYVVRAFNSDKPYDRFLLEQIAGDELADYEGADVVTDEMRDNLIATGFLRMAADGTFANITNFVPDRLDLIANEIEVLSSAVMGLSIKCARCHSHKFDPLPQRDYYRLLAVFKGAYDENDWLPPTPAGSSHGAKDRYLTVMTTAERQVWESHNEKIQSEIDALNVALKKVEDSLTQKHREERLGKLPEVLRADLIAMLATPSKERSKVQAYLAEKFEKTLRIESEELATLEPDYKKAVDETGGKTKALAAQLKPQPLIRALWDRGTPSPTYILRRGNYLTPGRPVGPGVPSMLTDGKTPFEVKAPWPGSTKSGRRLAFARWLVQPDHPLTARVMVNRVWKHHFGKGIVNTLDNFGKAGAPPTHPELLDHLAVEFVRGGYSIKTLHRLMMTSATYRQSSSVTPEHERLDLENRLVSRMPLRRLDGEALRDALLSISGTLDETPYGPADGVAARADGLVTSVSTAGRRRRSVYVLQRRTQLPTLLENFDLPVMSPNCIERTESTVATQALHLMNNGMIHELAVAFAERIRREAGADPHEQVERAYLVALGRSPSDEERSVALDGLSRLTSRWVKENGNRRTVVEAETHLWIRESEPVAVYEDDLISVWSASSRDRARRYGLVEFDLKGLSGADVTSAHLELGVLSNGPIKMSAALIPSGIAGQTWESYHATKASAAKSLESFGRVELGAAAIVPGHFAKSAAATPDDLKNLLASAAGGGGLISLVLFADEDETAYAHDWDDGVDPNTKRNPPRLVFRDSTPDLEEASKAALETFCHALMNSAAFLYID